MQTYPHHYSVRANGGTEGSVEVAAAGLSALATWPPPQFGGPPGHWSPESLLVAAVADCFILSFRAVARASRLEWDHLEVDVEGVLDRIDGVTRFTRFTISPRLVIPHAEDAGRASSVLDKAKRVCLVSNSLNAESVLHAAAVTIAPAAAGV